MTWYIGWLVGKGSDRMEKYKFFSGIFQGKSRIPMGFIGAKKMKNGSDLMRQIARKSNIYNKNKKLGRCPWPALQGSHKGEIPLDPRRPPETVVLWGRKFCVLGKFVIVWFFQEKVSNSDLYKWYATNSCVTNTFCRIIVAFKGSIPGSVIW